MKIELEIPKEFEEHFKTTASVIPWDVFTST